MRDEMWAWIWRGLIWAGEDWQSLVMEMSPLEEEGRKPWISFLGPLRLSGWFEATSSSYNRPTHSAICRSMRVKIVTSFLELHNHYWGLRRMDVFSNKYLLGENLVLNIGQKWNWYSLCVLGITAWPSRPQGARHFRSTKKVSST